MTVNFADMLKVATEESAAKLKSRSSLPGSVFILDAPDEIEGIWGVHPNVLWAKGEGFMIAGQQGSGKTTIAQQLVLRLAGVLSGNLLGLPVPQLPDNKAVLYLAMDRPLQARRSFRRMAHDSSPEMRALMDRKVHDWMGPLPGDVTGAMMADPYALANWVKETFNTEEVSIGAVVFDSVKDIMPDLSDGKVGQAINSCWQGLLQEGIEVLALHHDRKSSGGESRTTDIDAIYGSAWLTSGLGSVVKIIGDPGAEEVTLHHVKQPGELVGPIPALHDHTAGITVVNEAERLRTVEEILLEARRVMSTSEISTALYGTVEKKDLQATRRRLRKAVEKTRSVKHIPRGNGNAEDMWQLMPVIVTAADTAARKGS